MFTVTVNRPVCRAARGSGRYRSQSKTLNAAQTHPTGLVYGHGKPTRFAPAIDPACVLCPPAAPCEAPFKCTNTTYRGFPRLAAVPASL